MTQNNGRRKKWIRFLAWEVPKKWILEGPKKLIMDGLDYRWNVKLDTEINHSIYAVRLISEKFQKINNCRPRINNCRPRINNCRPRINNCRPRINNCCTLNNCRMRINNRGRWTNLGEKSNNKNLVPI